MAFNSKQRIRIVSNEERERLKNFRQKKLKALKPKPLPPLSPSPLVSRPVSRPEEENRIKEKETYSFFVGEINHETVYYSSGLNIVTITAPNTAYIFPEK